MKKDYLTSNSSGLNKSIKKFFFAILVVSSFFVTSAFAQNFETVSVTSVASGSGTSNAVFNVTSSIPGLVLVRAEVYLGEPGVFTLNGDDIRFESNSASSGIPNNVSRLRFSFLQADGVTLVPVNDFRLKINDIDGPNNEGLATDCSSGVRFVAVADPTNITLDNSLPDLNATGSMGESGGTSSRVMYEFNDVNLIEINNYANSGFVKDFDMDNDLTISTPLYSVCDLDTDNDGRVDTVDLDDDNDGILDTVEASGNEPNGDHDGDGLPNYVDVSDDTGASATYIANADGSTTSYVDTDSNGTPDVYDNLDADGDGIPNHLDNDSDNDGCYDALEGSGGFTLAQVDSNGELTGGINNATGVPNLVGAGGQTDVSGNNPNVTAGECDDDADGVINSADLCPGDDTADLDSDGIPDGCDPDDDGDGIPDVDENANCGAGTTIPSFFFNEDFGTGNRTSTPFTNYCYEDGSGLGACSLNLDPNTDDGEYSIVQFPNPYNVNTGASDFAWDSNGDHTGDPNGRMAVFNASLASQGSGEFYNRTISGLIPNVNVDISLWIKNILLVGQNGILPNVTIEIRDLSNNVIASSNTGDIPENVTWTNYTATFNPGAITDIKFVLINNAVGGVGNDLAIDDISLAQTLCDSDDDGIINQVDLDSDNDGIPDIIEGNGDQDNDGILNYLDIDADGDGVYDVIEAGHGQLDADGDGDIDGPDADFGNNGLYDLIEDNDTGTATINYTPLNSDGDALFDFLDVDDDNDGVNTEFEVDNTDGDGNPNTGVVINTDGDAFLDYLDVDDDGDGVDTVDEGPNPDGDGNPNTGNTQDSDGDLVFDYLDIDDDGDGIDTADEDPNGDGLPLNDDTDGDGVPNYLDLDSDNDGIPDSVEGTADTDGDGIPNHLDLDSDNDGIVDIVEAGGTDADGDGQVDYPTPGDPTSLNDANDNGLDDTLEGTPLPIPDTDLASGLDTLPNYLDLDSDGDGIADIIEAGGTDADGDGHVDYGTAGDPSTLADGNSNGLLDSLEGAGALPTPNTDGTFGADYADIDADGDGIVDNIEGQTTADYIAPANTDVDGDGLDDNYDGDDELTVGIGGGAGPFGAVDPTNTDGADEPDYLDLDSDNDGDSDALEGWDTNNDGTANIVPSGGDSDGDGLDNAYDVDDTQINVTNGQNPGSFPDLDTPGGEPDWRDALDIDHDGDGIDDPADLDDDNDGVPDSVESGGNEPDGDADGDGIPNWLDTSDGGGAGDGSPTDYVDLDGNGIPDVYDTDGDGVPNHLDLDSDNDGIYDLVESGQIDAANNVVDTNNDGIIDAANSGTVGANGLFDPIETDDTATGTVTNPTADSDSDGIPDSNEINADNDGCVDTIEAGFTDPDSNGLLGNGTFGAGLVVNANGVVTGQGGYTTPDDNDSNGVYDFQEFGEAVSITTQPIGQTIIINSNANFDVTGTSPVYQWQESTDNGATWNAITDGGANPTYSGASTASLTLTTVPASYEGYQYRVVLSSPGYACDGNVTSDEVTLNLFSDYDGDGIPDFTDLDDDNDGVPDSVESGGNEPDGDADGDGIPNWLDTSDGGGAGDGSPTDYVDLDGNGIPDVYDTDGDGVPNHLDLDSDNDGIYDLVESGQIDAANNVVDTNNDGIIDAANSGTVGANGLFDPIETDDTATGTVTNPTADSDSDGIPDSNEINADNDGCVDTIEAGFTDPDSNGLLGNGTFGAGLVVNANGVVTGQGGYTTPDDNDSNGVYDFQEFGEAVTLTVQPIDEIVTINATANFDVTGTSPVYQWQESTDGGFVFNNISDNATYSGTTTATLTITNVPVTFDGNRYRVILSSPGYACDGNITSDSALLTVQNDFDGDGISDVNDLDDDNDGIPDSIEGMGDLDGDGIPNHNDLDADGDGVYDTNEAGFADLDADNDGVIDGVPADFGANGLFDGIEDNDSPTAVITYVILNTDGDGQPNFLDVDDDGDGINTEFENPDGDNNGDPADAQDSDNDSIPDYLDIDDDNDGVYTEFEVSNADGDGNPNTGVGIPNTDGDLLPNYLDADDDGDGVDTVFENPNPDGDGNPNTGATQDTDGNGVPDYLDTDDDGDSILTIFEGPNPDGDNDPNTGATQDSDGDGTPDYLDVDDDGDGVYTEFEGPDPNGDGNPDDGQDTDNDGIPDYLDIDDDGDGIDTADENPDPNGDGNPSDAQDTDDDGTPDYLDTDDDNDGIDTVDEDLDGDGDPTNDDTDGDGHPNYLDIDDDGDGILTLTEGPSDEDSDGNPNYLDLDADNDGIPDNVEGQPTADYVNPSGSDSDGNGLDDAYENIPGAGVGIIPVNTDGADNDDYLDLDSDNDTVPDSIEGHDFDADGSPDIAASGIDSDTDGLDDAYDGSIGDYADPNGLTVVDNPATDLPNRDGDVASIYTGIDGDSEVDYRDTDDDGDGILTEDEDADGDGDPTNDNCDEDSHPDYLDFTACDIVPDGFSPNGDGVNDTLVIPALAQYPNFTMEVYDRWGNIVYEYSNNGRAQPLWWDGFSTGSRTINKGQRVPVGTYFYVIEFNQDRVAPISGWVYINY